MCPRTQAGGGKNNNLPITELLLADFHTMFPPELVRKLRQFLFCGNYGDIITATDALPILEYLKQENPNIRIKLVTNGSGRNRGFWTQLAKLVSTVTFSIDGLGSVNALYRQRTNWNRIMEAVGAYLTAGGRAEWDFLVFRHNEHQVEEARALAQKLGFAKFNLKRTQRFLVDGQPQNRFPVRAPDGKLDRWLELPSFTEFANDGFVDLTRLQKLGTSYHDYLGSTRIHCKAVRDMQVYVSATGHLFPCCWLGQIYESWPSPMAQEIRTRINELPNKLEDLDLRKHSFAEIIDGYFFQQIVTSGFVANSPLRISACARMCGEIDTHEKQWANTSSPSSGKAR